MTTMTSYSELPSELSALGFSGFQLLRTGGWEAERRFEPNLLLDICEEDGEFRICLFQYDNGELSNYVVLANSPQLSTLIPFVSTLTECLSLNQAAHSFA